MNGVPRATARAAKGKRSIGAKVETVVQPKWRNVPPSPQITCAFGKVAACLRWPRSRRTVSRSSCRACADWPVRRSSLCRHHEAAVARGTRKTPVCMGMPFIRKNRPESGPDPSEGPQRPSSVSHKTRRTLSLFPGTDPVLLKNQRFLNERLNTGPSPETLDLEQQIQIDRQDRQRISAKPCL